MQTENCPHCGKNPHMSYMGNYIAAYTDKQVLAAIRYHRLRIAGINAVGNQRRVLLLAAFYQGCAIARSCDKMGISSDRLLHLVENDLTTTNESLIDQSDLDLD